MVRDQMGDIPLIIGGIEASLRRMAHYDYWDHKVRRSILQDSQADLLVYGMGELTLLEIARLLDRGVPVSSLNSLRGTCSLVREDQLPKKRPRFWNSLGLATGSGGHVIRIPCLMIWISCFRRIRSMSCCPTTRPSLRIRPPMPWHSACCIWSRIRSTDGH